MENKIARLTINVYFRMLFIFDNKKNPEEVVLQWETNIGTTDLSDSIRKKIRNEAVQFFEKSTCRLGNEIHVCVNPTMLHPTSLLWQVESAFPFDGYLPLTKEELNTLPKDKILIRSCQKILKNLVSNYRQRTATTAIFFHLGNALEFCYAETEEFDVIDCSNLADHIGLPNVINASSSRLSNNPGAVLLTESMSWRKLAYSLKQYVEEALCAPLSMIPTIYGLRLASHVQLGHSTAVGLQVPKTHPAILSWRKAPPFTNIPLCPSPMLTGCLEQLARKCFIVESSKEDSDSEERIRLHFYTAKTFHYVMNSMIQRTGGDGRWLKIDFPSVFNLNRKILDAWKNGQKILKMSASHFRTPLECQYLETFKKIPSHIGRFGVRFLRLVLAPRTPSLLRGLTEGLRAAGLAVEIFRREFASPNVHFIDNFQLEIEKNSAGEIETASVSFLLVPDHGLDKTHLLLVFDILSGLPFIVFESMESLRSENYQLPYPFQVPAISPSGGNMQMKVDSCIELEDQYQLKVKMESCGKNHSCKFSQSFVSVFFKYNLNFRFIA